MKVAHKIPKLNLSKDAVDNPVAILSNRIGGFVFLSDPVISKYNGLFVNYDLQVYGILHNIGIADSRYDSIDNNLSHIVRKHKGNEEKIAFPEGINGIIYSLNTKASINIDFDCRKVHDLRSFGRMYRIDVLKDKIIVDFTKHTDGRDDDSEDVDEFKMCIVIQPKAFSKKTDYKFIDRWLESYFSYDHGRKDSPSHRYFYRPFVLDAKDVFIAVGRTKDEAVAELAKLKKYKPKQKEYVYTDKKKAGADAAAAFVCAQGSLDSLKTRHEGITRMYAGYPWFFQMWARDENVSIGALIRKGEFDTVKSILFKYLDNISKDGRLPNLIPSPHLGSSDGVGWFWKRMGDFIEAIKASGKSKLLSEDELTKIKKTLALSIKRIEKGYLKEGLIFSKTKETWMDTVWHAEDGREGFPIEIQALHLNMLRLMYELSEEKKYRISEEKMKERVLEVFWKDGVLYDMEADKTQRTNIFLAYYAYPDLLLRKDWQTAFESCLDKTWQDWGGLSSIAKDHPLYTPEYTGKDNQSYHRGDSWYWINNLAAVCLHRNNPIAFEDKVKKILSASADEILWSGAVGHAAEVSSASHSTSDGCFAQAWSASMFIELVYEVFGVGK